MFLILVMFLCGLSCVLAGDRSFDHFTNGEIGWGIFFLLCSVGLLAFAVFVILTV